MEGRLAVEVSTGPGCQPTGGGDPDVPAGEEDAESDSITPEHADIDVAGHATTGRDGARAHAGSRPRIPGWIYRRMCRRCRAERTRRPGSLRSEA